MSVCILSMLCSLFCTTSLLSLGLQTLLLCVIIIVCCRYSLLLPIAVCVLLLLSQVSCSVVYL
ncbi:hypothetical protein BGX38DRAFT_1204889, partial [Terfezia claveryi]